MALATGAVSAARKNERREDNGLPSIDPPINPEKHQAVIVGEDFVILRPG